MCTKHRKNSLILPEYSLGRNNTYFRNVSYTNNHPISYWIVVAEQDSYETLSLVYSKDVASGIITEISRSRSRI
jgi:hypothetical protein